MFRLRKMFLDMKFVNRFSATLAVLLLFAPNVTRQGDMGFIKFLPSHKISLLLLFVSYFPLLFQANFAKKYPKGVAITAGLIILYSILLWTDALHVFMPHYIAVLTLTAYLLGVAFIHEQVYQYVSRNIDIDTYELEEINSDGK